MPICPRSKFGEGGKGDLNDGLSAVSSFDCVWRANREAPHKTKCQQIGLEDLWLEARPFNSQPYRFT